MDRLEEKKLLETFGFNLKIERIKSKLSQEKLAEKAEVSNAYISNTELGKYNISLMNAYKLARAVNKTIEELLQDNT